MARVNVPSTNLMRRACRLQLLFVIRLKSLSEKPVAEDVDCGTGADCGLQPSEAEFRGQKAEESVGKRKEWRGWRKIVRNFTPSEAHISIDVLFMSEDAKESNQICNGYIFRRLRGY